MARDEQQRREMGARIKELRAASGLKQETIAEACGVKLRTYQMWQAGDITPGQDNLEKLADLFHVTPKFILRGETPDLSPAPLPDDTVTELLARMEAIEEQLRLLRVGQLARAMAILQRLDEALPPKSESQRRRHA